MKGSFAAFPLTFRYQPERCPAHPKTFGRKGRNREEHSPLRLVARIFDVAH
jgi:hypothetical protein